MEKAAADAAALRLGVSSSFGSERVLTGGTAECGFAVRRSENSSRGQGQNSTFFPRRQERGSLRRTAADVPAAALEVVVHQSGGLQKGINDGRADESEAAGLEVASDAV